MAELKSKLGGLVVRIQNQERMIRQGGLKDLLAFCVADGNLNSESSVEIFDSVYLCLIKCYSDKFEMCRSLSCTIVSEILKHLEQNDYYLSLLVPVIAKRLAAQDVVEESEEMRLQLMKQLHYIINKYKDLKSTGTVRGHPDGEDRLLKPYNDIIDILKNCLLDSYPAILKESCEVIKATAIASPSFHYRAEALAEPLMCLLKHRHSPIRVAAVEALGMVSIHIHSNAELIKRILKDLSPVVMDPVPFVRRGVGRVGCLFLMKLRDRYSFFERILPLVLCCLHEETVEVQAEIESLWQEAGAQYYLENQNELQKLNLIDAALEGYPDYIKRPTFGCRAIVRRSLQVLNIILHEMEDWKEDVRLHSTKLLMQIVVHSEDHLATKYFDINAILCKTCDDPEPPVAKYAIEVAKLIGHFVGAKTWSKYIFEELKVRQKKLGILKCMNALYQGSSDASRFENSNELLDILLDSSICHNDSEPFQVEHMKLLEILIDGIQSDDETIFKNLYIIALKSTAVSSDNEVVKSAGVGVMSQLAAKRETEVSELHKKFLKSALDTLDSLDKLSDFEQVTILYGIICLCGFQKSFIGELKRVIVNALEHCEAEGKIKIFSGIAMASLKWDEAIGMDDPNENFLMLASFVGEIIAPHLIWHAGRTAESVRTMATTSLCSLAQGTSEENARRIVESLMVPLVSLIDDHSITTRTYALWIFQYVGPLKYEQLKTLAPALLSRLDDAGSSVREKAAICLGRLELREDEEDAQDHWETLLSQVLSTMLIHVESPEINLRDALIESVKTLSRKHRKVYRKALSDSTISQDLKRKLPPGDE